MRWTSTASYFSRLVGCLLLGLLLNARPGQAQTSQGLVADSTELRVLHQFYTATKGATWSKRTNWPTSTTWPATLTSADFATWYGVTVTNGDVTNLSLASNNLTGSLPGSLSQLAQIQSIYLGQNSLSGPIPASFGQLSNLLSLSLGINRLSGPIPPELGQLTRLQNLALNSNPLTGPIPDPLSQLTQLRGLVLYHTTLSGTLPASLGKLIQLQSLQLSGCSFTGPIPRELGQLSQLQTLLLGQNQLRDSIPSSLGNLRQLTYLSLVENQLSGPIPASLGQLTHLNYLNLDFNQLSGSIPASLGQLVNLTDLNLYYNQLSGPIPAELSQITYLQNLNLYNNQLSGPIPASLGQLAWLQSLYLYNNQLSGPIPSELGQLASLQGLDLYNNQLSGPIPISLGQLSALSSLVLFNNRLVGSIPGSFGQLKKLRYLDISYNQLSGSVPTELSSLPGLGTVYLNSNKLSGSLPRALCTLPGLYLVLDNNKLTDTPDLGTTTGLTATLSLTGNLLDFPALERLYQNPNSARFRTLRLTNQQSPQQIDTISFTLGSSLVLQPRRQGLYTYQYQWQRLVGGQWADMPGDTLATKTWARATAAEQGTYRRREHDRWFTNPSLGPTELYSAPLYADMLPYAPLARNLPDDANPPPRALQAAPAQGDATAPAVAPEMNYVRVWTPRQALTQAASGPTRPAGVRREQWLNVTGGVAAIPVTTPPQAVQQLPSLEATTTSVFQYGARLRAWLTPPQTGSYTFWLSATNAGALWLSTDQDPAHAVPLATCTQFTSGPQNYTRYPAQQSAPVTLTAGQPYYLEVRHQHDYGPGYVSVTWQLPDGSQFGQPLAGQYLRPYEDGAPGPDAPTWTVEQAAMSTQYLDGLGRPVQTVQWQASPSKHDLVQPQAYDGLGREPRQFLPYAADSTDGGYRPRGLTEQGHYYAALPPGPPSPQDLTRGVARTGVAFSETMFEASPLNRVAAQAAPGEAWQLTGGHHQERAERPNVFADSLLRFAPSYAPTDPDPHCQGSYAPGELWGVLTRDEHGYWAAEWKDKLGQLVAKQVQTQAPGQGAGAARRWLRTYYAYDDFQHLRVVLPPEASRRQLAAVRALAPTPPPAGVRWEQWANVPGTQVADIPVSQAPTSVQTLPQLELVSSDFHYGARLRAWLLPPQDGAYSFYLTGNDAAELWLSTDADPTHKARLATSSQFLMGPHDYKRWPEQQSAPVQLRANQVYYLEVLHKQEWGDGFASVSWQLPDGSQLGAPIAGAYLSPYDPAGTPPPAPGSVPLPAAALPATAQPFVFHYRYDGRGRQIAKQVPGQDGETLVVYDQLDRPVLSQDAQQRTRQEWSWTKYDALGRIILSGLTTRQDTLGQVSLQNIATADTATSHQYEQRTSDGATFAQFYTTTQSFPQLGQGGQFSAQGFSAGPALSASYYDDYDFNHDGQPDADAHYDTSTDAQFPAGAAPVADALRTTGMPTRTLTRVLGVAEGDLTQAAWLTTTTFYDERARPVQVQTTNARKDPTTHQPYLDVLTTQLDFTGKVVQRVAVHQGPSHTPVAVREFFTYDHSNRLVSTRQQLPGEARPALLDSVQYNELGQVTRKSLATGRLRQDVDYAYNIRGWLTSLNDPYSPNPTKHDLFHLSLHYERGFTTGYEQYNGNLTGQTWRGRDGVQRATGYVYDPLNRILQGDFVARTLAATPSAGAWTQELDNYRLSFVSYDDNGNLATLRRRGLLQAGTSHRPKQYGAVDNLSYAYQGNRLQAVDDAVSGNETPRLKGYNGAPTSLAGDFQEAGVQLGQEYLYDANGNLTADKNKGITGILYNHLNLPRQIHFGQVGDSVVFRYAASGQKVARLVYQTGKPLARTDYLGPYQYEGDSLKFFPHAEGRVLRFVQYDDAHQPTVSYQREFTVKDHLGNLRLAYRAGQVRTLLAGLELNQPPVHQREAQQFDSLSVSAPVAQNVGGLAYSGTYVAKLNAGGSSPQPLGPLTQLGVQKGDTVTVTAFGYYAQPVAHGFFFSLGSFLASLFPPAQAPPPGLEASKRKNLPLLQVGVAAGLSAIPQLSGGVPKGYLRVLVFDKDSALVAQPVRPLSPAANGGYERLRLQVLVPQDGYVSAYVGNESDVDVLFDDVQLEHRPGLQVQETQYDPAGLELAGLAAPSPGIRGLNNYRFNGKEFQADLGLAWNHQDWRFFDPQLLRWHSGDPEVENGQESWTPYSFGYDNAVRYNDANGRAPGGPGDLLLPGTGFLGTLAAALEAAGSVVAAPEVIGAGLIGGLIYVGMQAGGTARPNYVLSDEPIYTSQAQYDKAHPTTSAKNENGRVDASSGTRPARRVGDGPAKGRLGNKATKDQVKEVANEMENRGYEVTGGGGKRPEEHLPGPEGKAKGGSYPDITATKDGRTVRINTVDTKADGTPTNREAANAARIRQQTPSDHLLLIPKK